MYEKISIGDQSITKPNKDVIKMTEMIISQNEKILEINQRVIEMFSTPVILQGISCDINLLDKKFTANSEENDEQMLQT